MILVLAFILWFLCGQRYGFGELKNWMYAMPSLPEEVTEDYHPPGYTQPGNVSVLELWHPEGTKNLGHYRHQVPGGERALPGAAASLSRVHPLLAGPQVIPVPFAVRDGGDHRAAAGRGGPEFPGVRLETEVMS